MEYDVVVVGAGAAGMIAARELGRGGRSVVVLEARDRLGGRLRQVDYPRALAPIELGGEFVHGRPRVSYELLHEYGATVSEDAERSFHLRDGRLQPAAEGQFAPVSGLLATALDRDEDESVEALIARNYARGVSRETGRWTRRLVSGFDAADPAKASARAIAAEWAGDASADGAQSRPLGGYGPLIAHLARSLDPGRVELRLSTTVSRISRDGRGVVVEARARNRAFALRARRCLVTVPHGVLVAPSNAEGAIGFDPPLPAATTAALAQIVMGPVIKVVLCFRDAFWETLNGGSWRDGAFFTGDGVFPTFWTQLPVRANILVAWVGGPAADGLAEITDSERIDRALECAGRYFGDPRAAEAAFECAYMHDWQRDPFARGAYSYVVVGGEHAREELATPIDGKVWLAGEATAARGEGGTVAGALESGLRAAREILATTA